MYTDAALRTADQPAGAVLSDVRVGQLAFLAIGDLVGVRVETHFRDEGFGPLVTLAVHQRHSGSAVAGL